MIKTGSVLEGLCRAVDKHEGRVKRAQARVELLREQYLTVHYSKRREIAGKGFRAREALAKAEADLRTARAELAAEEARLARPDSFLRFA